MAFREPRPPAPEPPATANAFQNLLVCATYLSNVAPTTHRTPAQLAEIEKKISHFEQETIAILGPVYKPPSQEFTKIAAPGRQKPPPRTGAFRSEGSS
jgi:hypothetical protein